MSDVHFEVPERPPDFDEDEEEEEDEPAEPDLEAEAYAESVADAKQSARGTLAELRRLGLAVPVRKLTVTAEFSRIIFTTDDYGRRHHHALPCGEPLCGDEVSDFSEDDTP